MLLLFFDIISSFISVVLVYQVFPERVIGFVSNLYLELFVFTFLVIAIFAYLDLYNYLVFLNRFRYIYRTTKGIVYVFIFYLLWLAISSSLYTQYVFSVFILLFVFSFLAYFSRIILLPIFSLLLSRKGVVLYAPEGNSEDIRSWLEYHTISGVKIIGISKKRDEIEEYVKRRIPIVLSTYTENWEDLIDQLFFFKDKVPVILFAPILAGIDDVDYWAYLGNAPVIYFRWKDSSKFYLLTKKIIDFLGAIFAILLFSPFMVAAAIGIKLTSEGPVFFIDNRIGKKGKVFKMFKFRSMVVTSGDEPHREYVKECINGKKELKFKLMNDSRVTSLGKLLRKTSIDEMPQFFNVLKGELSLVGPRPPMEYEVKQYSDWHKKRLSVEQGITGLWQIFGRARLTFAKSCFLDIYYAENRTLLFDLHLLSQTPHTIFFGKGAY